MLSICIPVYNYDVTTLVGKLCAQLKGILEDAEIIVMDDGSILKYKELNRKIQSNSIVRYVELQKNLGSAAIRNQLAMDAKNKRILFLDSDSDIADDYIDLYLPYISSNDIIIYGGRTHPVKMPSPSTSLRWKVGVKKEDHNAKKRALIPNKSFMSNNFMTHKDLFRVVSFDETIQRSGHEDTMYGIELEKKGIKIVHINNPVVHIGLEENDDFIKKTEQRIETLKFIADKYKNDPLITERITLLKFNSIISKFKLNGFLKWIFHTFQSQMKTLLKKTNPNLIIYDIYKLGYYNTL